MKDHVVRPTLISDFAPKRVSEADNQLLVAGRYDIVGDATRKNAIFLKRFLNILNLVSGLKVNSGKCCLYSVNIESNRSQELADILRCNHGDPNFVYLGIKGVQDTWRWEPSPDGYYTVHGVYEWLVNQDGGDEEAGDRDSSFGLVWNKFAPLKVDVHAWRLLRERLPTTTKLQRQHSLPAHVDVLCVLCGNCPELVRHIFFECEFSYKVWMECCKWMGVVTILSSIPSTNLLHFSNFFRGKRGKNAAVCVWECVVWSLWKWRNAKVFRAGECRVSKVVEDVKARLWSWLVVKDIRCTKFIFADWSANPRLVLGC
ncbi:hypothetical protein ACS0TY_030029 [Phlomoides rotata]